MNIRPVPRRLGHDHRGLAVRAFPTLSQLIGGDRKIVSTMNASNVHAAIVDCGRPKSMNYPRSVLDVSGASVFAGRFFLGSYKYELPASEID